MLNKLFLKFPLLLVILAGHFSYGQHDEGLIYGKVSTKTGNNYVGQIRWEDEEVFWHDIFNSIKTYGKKIKVEINIQDNENEQKTKERHKWELFEIWDDKYSGQVHQFTCRFGDIKTIVPSEGEELVILFKNDYKLIVRGGSNDVDALIQVIDYEIGQIKIEWENVARIDFFDTPSTVRQKFGNPLYGTVKTDAGYWTGMVQWDNDERLDVDILDGEHEGDDIHMPFSNIKCIRKKGCHSEIVKQTGSAIEVSNSNDVDCENRGINIIIDQVGTLSVPWNAFQQVCFDHTYRRTGEPYRAYPEPKRLIGSVRTIDRQYYVGYIVFDKDESWDFEMLEGKMDNIKYIIPFRNIASISPRNSTSSTIVLKNGQRLLLGELQDVSARNEGILIYSRPKEGPDFIEWGNIDEISFE